MQSWIRPLTLDDIPQVVLLGSQMHQESIFRDMDYSPKKLMELLERMAVGSRELFAFVYDDKGVRGFIAGFISAHFFGDDLSSGDFALYVDPEYRGERAGPALVKAYVAYCRDMGVKDIRLGVSAGIDDEQVAQVYRGLGFTTEFTGYRLT